MRASSKLKHSYVLAAESYTYDAWGNVLAVLDASGTPLPASALGNRYFFQGREYSWASGLYNFRARWYDPATGRWLSNDPVGISGSLNQYTFCANDPVNFVDPSGLCSEDESDWVLKSAYVEKAFRRGARKAGASIQEIYEDAAGNRQVWHTVIDDQGRIVDSHPRPFYKPRVGDLGP